MGQRRLLEGEIEIRQVFEAPVFGAEFTPELREQEERLGARRYFIVEREAAKSTGTAPRPGAGLLPTSRLVPSHSTLTRNEHLGK
ncbi:MAG TPA: hypothetical protein VN428_01515 [Bryobacteraceae bacterium]|nr:hypothetical protein [Bryobacteraceae bacterium]